MGADAPKPEPVKDTTTDGQENQPQDEKEKLTDELSEKKELAIATTVGTFIAAATGGQSFAKAIRKDIGVPTETLERLGATDSQNSRLQIIQQVLVEDLSQKQQNTIEGTIGVIIALILILVRNRLGRDIHKIEDTLEKLKGTTDKQ